MRPIKSLSRILVSASGLALATAILAQPTIAHAQSFQGTVGSVVGTATVVAGTNTTNVTVSGPSAVINWIPNDNASTGGPIIFQTAGTTATFTGVSGDFAVLNRIIPTGSTRPIQFNGTVRSEIANSGLATPGGTVFFYSPGGILVGSSAIFDIGNLGLTTSDVPYASNGRFDAGVFQPVTVAGSGISILPGAQINASVDGSYVALVAPRVENGGRITVNGSAALVAADAATITFSPSGLFDILVDSGTSATGTVAANTGSITGSAGTSALNHRIYMVAVAKNEAISMALGSGSTLGFDIAAAADLVGNSIVLSGGRDVIVGAASSSPSIGSGTGIVSISVTDANVTSNFVATASGGVDLKSVSDEGLKFAHDLIVTEASGASSGIYADASGNVSVAGNVSIDGSVIGTTDAPSATGQSLAIQATNGGTVTIGGNVALKSRGNGVSSVTPGTPAGDGFGGTVTVGGINQSAMTVFGTVLVDAIGIGGTKIGTSGGAGGNGQGGTVALLSTGVSKVDLGATSLYAGGAGGVSTTGNGGSAQGGSVTVTLSAGRLALGGNSTFDASAIAGAGGVDGNIGVGGAAIGGVVNVSAGNLSGGLGDILSSAGALLVAAFGEGGLGQTGGGSGAGGQIAITVNAANTLSVGSLTLDADGSGADHLGSAVGNAGSGTGGTINLVANGGTITAGDIDLIADGLGGNVDTPVQAGLGIGGSARLSAQLGGSIIAAESITILSTGGGGDALVSGSGGDGVGGSARMETLTGGAIDAQTDYIYLTTTGSGGATFGAGAISGSGTGGTSSINVQTGSITSQDDITIEAPGLGGAAYGAGATGGSGTGNLVDISVIGGQLAVRAGTMNGSAYGRSSDGAIGGDATGGSLTFTIADSSVNVFGRLDLFAAASTGTGAATGGNINLSVTKSAAAPSSSLTTGEVDLYAYASGASLARGGSARFVVDGGMVSTGALDIHAFAGDFSSVPSTTNTAVGAAIGGTAALTIQNGGSATFSGASSLDAGASGHDATGVGGFGSGGTGGLAQIQVLGGIAEFQSSLDVLAAGLGAAGANSSGDGVGGTASITLLDSTLDVAGAVNVNANGTGGSTSAAGTGGDAVAGISRLTITNSNANLLDVLYMGAFGVGGNGTGAGADAAFGAGGQVALTVNSGSISVTTDLQMSAIGRGGSGVASAGDGGVGTGGSITLFALDGLVGDSVITSGSFHLGANSFGGNGFGDAAAISGAAGGRGGNALGGEIAIGFANDGGTISGGSLTVNANGVAGSGGSGAQGSASGGAGGRGGEGGSGQGGIITIDSLKGTGAGSGELNFGLVDLFAQGIGGAGGSGGVGASRGEGGNGGSGRGGNVNVQFQSGSSQMLVSGRFYGSADGFGGQAGGCDDGCLNAGGSGTGGKIFFGSTGDSTGNLITLGDALTLSTDASGGASQGAIGGSATGGETIMKIGEGQTFSGTEITLTSIAFGGSAASEGTAGSAQGGTASIIAGGTGVIGASGLAYISAQGLGGAGLGATTIGGAGHGGISRIFADGGTLSFGQVSVTADGYGGHGNATASSGVGGSGEGGIAEIVTGLQTGGNTNSSSITVTDGTTVSAYGFGGNGYTAGAGIGGRASVLARQGSIDLGDMVVNAGALGGSGTAGGTGGAGIGGLAEVYALNDLSGPSRIITKQLEVRAIGKGGSGGSLDTAGIVGGNGGRGQGGQVRVLAGAGNGNLEANILDARAGAAGGAGGSGTGAAGGNGGNAQGGAIQLGSFSGSDTGALNSGAAAYGSVTARANAFGGAGGAGDSATAGAAGGNGGNAEGGRTVLLVRGANVTLANASTFEANATGGDGGLGFSTGTGGNAISGSSNAVVTNRFEQPTQRGNLVARDLTFTAMATGGSGSTPGKSTYAPGAMQFNVVNSSVTATNLKFTASATSLDTNVAGAADAISLTNATATIAVTFDFNTVGATSLQLDQSSLIADSIAITAANWLADPLVPTTLGTLTGKTSLSLTSGQDIVAHANLATQGALALSAPGRIDLGAINAFGAIRVTAGSSLTLGDVSSGSSIELEAVDEVLVGTLSAAEFVAIASQGNVTAGNLSAGTGTPSGVNGDLYTVGIRSGGSVSTGAIFAASDLGIFAANALTTGQATAYDMLLLSGGDVSTGGLDAANRVLIAGATMAGLGETAAGFDKDLVFAGSLVRTAGSINLSAPATVSAFTAAAQGTFTSGAITVTPSATGSGDLRIDTGGAITTTNLTAANAVHLVSATSIQTGAVTSQTSDVTFAAPTITLGNVQTASGISISGQTVSAGNLAAGVGSVSATGTHTIQTGAITVDGAITVAGGSETTVASALATNGSVGIVSAGELSLGNITSGDSIDLTSLGALIAGDLTSAASITIDAQGNVTAGSLTAGTGTPTGVNGDLHSVVIRSGGSVSTDAIFAAADLGIVAADAITAGQVTAYDMLLLGSGNVSTGGLNAVNRVLIADASMAELGQTAAGFEKDLVFAGSPVRTAGSINLSAPASASAFTAAAQGTLTSGAITVTPSATGSGDLRIDTGGAITTTNLTAANAVSLVSATSIQTGAVTSQTSDVTFAAPTITLGNVQTASGISISGQTVSTGNLAASAGSVSATGTHTIQTGAITADGAITVAGGSETTVASASASKGLIEVTATGALEIGDATAGVAGVRLIAGSTTASGGLQSGQGSITAGNVQAAGLVQLYAGGTVASEALGSSLEGVKVASFGGAVRTGEISVLTNVLVSAVDSVSIGGAIKARDVILLSGGNVSAGDVFAGAIAAASGGPIADATGRVLIANRSMAADRLLRSVTSDYSTLLADAPVAVGGTVKVDGDVVTGRFAAFSKGNMTGGRISAFQNLEVESGGLVTVSQRWAAPALQIASSDIRVVDNGSSQSILSGLHSTAAGTVSLISMSGSPALIGDGLTGSGYALSDAELALVSAGEISIAAVDNSANATDMLIGNLSLTAGETVGISNVAGSTGRIVFSTGDRASQVPGGAIRIVGNLTGTGFASTNAIEFNSDRFELDAATGYLSLTQTGTALGGVVEIAAANIHVATGSILDRLAADPFYSGHLTDLDRPAARQRPDGVLRALGLDLFPKRTLYIQNTGTIFDPAGFFADFDSTSLTGPANDLSSSVSVIVNGKWQTRNGIASGTDAHDLVTESVSRSDFKADSSVNGCAITAAVCVSQLTRDPTPAISSQIQVTLKDSIGSTPQFAEDLNAPGEPESDYLMEAEEQVQKAAADEGKATPGPIAPRPQIVDMTSLQSQPQIAQPVTGSGKPSLVGTLADEGLTEGAEQ